MLANAEILLNNLFILQIQAGTVKVLIQLQLSKEGVKAAVKTLNQHMQGLLQKKAPSAAIEDLLLLLLAGAANSGCEKEIATVKEMCTKDCQCSSDTDEAAFVAAQSSVLSTCERLENKDAHKASLTPNAWSDWHPENPLLQNAGDWKITSA